MIPYVLAPAAASDLIHIWRYIRRESSTETANRLEAMIRSKMEILAGAPLVGHWRQDLTEENVRFFPVYSYLIVYRPDKVPMQVVAVLHGARDASAILKDRTI